MPESVVSCLSLLCHVQLQTEVPLGDSGTDVTTLLSPDLLPKFTSRPPPEMAACQTLVLAFVDALKKQELQVTSLKEAILSHKRHVNTLKQELSSACHREYGEEMERMASERGVTPVGVSSSMPDISTTRTVIGSSDTTSEPHNSFAPLQVDLSDQLSVTQTAAVPKTAPKHK
ncbi:hypothetical protein NP493_1558g00054 [Ridgeia piscesae]|uniref:Uncharacterized protein n=1 Tax=Ridgeia piscesae TaxID=27915 RepID=A0AAD9N9I0_RIDPI|nr:hypothetical protein NP493_1558g00054 [Ridgeia piscesae]